MSELNNLKQEENQEQTIDIKALLLKYLSYWQLFAISVLSVLVIAWVWLRFLAPVYNVSASLLVQEDDNSRGSGSAAFSSLQDLGMMTMTSNFNNELEVLHSRTLIKEVVIQLRLYTSVFEKRFFGYNHPLYKDSPVELFMTPVEAAQLTNPVKLDMEYGAGGRLDVKVTCYVDEEKTLLEQTFETLPAVLATPVGVITFNPGDTLAMQEDHSLRGYITSPVSAAGAYGIDLTVEASSKTTTVALISLHDSHKLRATDFVNCLVERYNRNANDEKNQVATKTAEFIEDRLAIINNELGSTENQLATFKQRSGLTDLTSNAQQALEESSRYDQQRVANETQISLVKYLRDYINNPANRNEVIPVNVGLEDRNLSGVIDQYNTMLSERNRLLLTSSEENPAVKRLDISLDAMRKGVLTTVAGTLKGLQIAKSDIERQTARFESRISQAPEQEKEFINIARQQEIKASLYTMLLQKREENAITLASTANNGRLIEEALADKYPIFPKKAIIYLVALILGILIPMGIIYLIDLFNYKIMNREDVEKLTKLPIIGEIPLTTRPDRGAIVVHENRNDMMEEVFRGLRTNIMFMLKPGDKVVMFTSTMPGEGKSFIAGNFAVSLAFMGKRVIILGLDIRKPGLNKVFNINRHGGGISNYLSNPDNNILHDLIQHSDISTNLDILPGGPVPPNPTELVARTALDEAISQLKTEYDYILIDSAPIGMVTDTAIIARVADALVYVCRAGYTLKEGFKSINTLKEDHNIDNVSTVINCIDLTSRHYTYYKKLGYGYGKRYGYGYGYGYGKEKDDKKEKE